MQQLTFELSRRIIAFLQVNMDLAVTSFGNSSNIKVRKKPFGQQ